MIPFVRFGRRGYPAVKWVYLLQKLGLPFSEIGFTQFENWVDPFCLEGLPNMKVLSVVLWLTHVKRGFPFWADLLTGWV